MLTCISLHHHQSDSFITFVLETTPIKKFTNKTMPKKSSDMKKQLKSTREEAILPNLPMELLKSNHIRQQSCLGTTKSWLTASRRCNNNKQPQHPQLAHLTDSTRCMWRDYWGNSLANRRSCCSSPPPGYPENLITLSRSYSYDITIPGGIIRRRWPPSLTLTLTEISVPAVVVWSFTYSEGNYSKWMTHESTTLDPYDAENRLMKFTNAVISSDGNKFYALSSQGCLVVMEEENEDRLTIKRVCKTRAVPSFSAKYFKEYLFASRGEIFLVFLIYGKGGVAAEVEVYRLHVGATFDLVKVDRLDGRVLFLDKECCLWVDSDEIGCKGDCIYFTGGLSGNDAGWWVYDMETRLISAAWKKRTRVNNRAGTSIVEYEPVLLGL